VHARVSHVGNCIVSSVSTITPGSRTIDNGLTTLFLTHEEATFVCWYLVGRGLGTSHVMTMTQWSRSSLNLPRSIPFVFIDHLDLWTSNSWHSYKSFRAHLLYVHKNVKYVSETSSVVIIRKYRTQSFMNRTTIIQLLFCVLHYLQLLKHREKLFFFQSIHYFYNNSALISV